MHVSNDQVRATGCKVFVYFPISQNAGTARSGQARPNKRGEEQIFSRGVLLTDLVPALHTFPQPRWSPSSSPYLTHVPGVFSTILGSLKCPNLHFWSRENATNVCSKCFYSWPFFLNTFHFSLSFLGYLTGKYEGNLAV